MDKCLFLELVEKKYWVFVVIFENEMLNVMNWLWKLEVFNERW